MTDAPERIWLWRDEPNGNLVVSTPFELYPKGSPEYIRADLHQQALDAAREEGSRAGVKEAMRVARVHNLGRDYECSQRQIDAIHALIDKPADPVAEAAIPYTPTTAQIQSVCYSMRHDYGLMTREEQETLEFHAMEAWKAVAKALAQKEEE